MLCQGSSADPDPEELGILRIIPYTHRFLLKLKSKPKLKSPAHKTLLCVCIKLAHKVGAFSWDFFYLHTCTYTSHLLPVHFHFRWSN